MTDTHATRGIKPAETTRSLLDKWSLVANAIMCAPELTAAQKCIAARLMWHMNCRYEECWPRQTTLASDLSMSPQTVLDGIKALVDYGWVIVRKRPGTSSAYRFDWSKAVAIEGEPEQAAPTPFSEVEAPPENGAKHGNNLTGEFSQSLSASPQETGGPVKAKGKSSRPRPLRWTDKPLSQRMGHDGRPVNADGDTDWPAMIWEVQFPALMALRRQNVMTPMSEGAARARLGKIVKDAGGAYPASESIAALLHSLPGGCPFDYLVGMKREKQSAVDKTEKAFNEPIDYSC